MHFSTVATIVVPLLLAGRSEAIPTKRASSDTCPYVFNKEGKPSLGDLGGGEPHDIGSLAIAAAPQWRGQRARSAQSRTSIRNGCRPSTVHSFQFEDTDANDQGGTNADITVDFRGSDDNNHFGGYLGNELYDNGDNAPHSAWVYILQNTMLYNAQLDAIAGSKWSTTRDSSEDAEMEAGLNVQSFFGAVPQIYSHLGKMLELVTGQETSQEEISGLSDGEIKETLDAAFESPVMIIPKESNKEGLAGNRIWIASKKVANQDKWSFFNPVEKEKATVELGLPEVKSLGEQIIFTTDHSALASD